MAKSYPQSIWDQLRESWENSPNISWQVLRNDIIEKFPALEIPSTTTISRRAKAQNWEKKSKGLTRLSNRTLNKNINKLESDTNNVSKKTNQRQRIKKVENVKKITVKAKKVEESEAVEGEYIPANTSTVTNDLDRRNSALTATKVIKRNRYVASDICKIVVDGVEKLNELKDEIFSLQEYDEDEINLIKEKFNKLNQIVSMGDSISRIFERTSKIEAVYWGLNIDDLKDQSEEIAKRNVHIENAQERLAAAKEKMAQDKVAAFKRKLEIIEMAEEIENEG